MSGKTVAIGAPNTDSSGGAVYIYVKGHSGWPTTPTTTLSNPVHARPALFGTSVAVSGDTVLVGARGQNPRSGAAYIYVRGASGWPTTPTAKLADPGNDSNFFGWSVAVSGTIAIVGAPYDTSKAGTVLIYVKGSSGWPLTPTAKLSDPAATQNDLFGWSLAISGTTVVVGAYGTTSDTGAAYIYVKGSSGWPMTPTAKLSDPAATNGDYFGWAVAMSGETVVVGAPETNSGIGAGYIYKA
jgi:hypothetical protein